MGPFGSQKYRPGCTPKALQILRHNLYPVSGVKWRERPHTLHREYGPNVKAWKDLEAGLGEGQGKE